VELSLATFSIFPFRFLIDHRFYALRCVFWCLCGFMLAFEIRPVPLPVPVRPHPTHRQNNGDQQRYRHPAKAERAEIISFGPSGDTHNYQERKALKPMGHCGGFGAAYDRGKQWSTKIRLVSMP
jgi:hypothetical protein